MKLSLRPLQSVRVLLTTIVVLFAILLYLGWSTFGELERQRQGPTDSAQWAIYQTSLEFHRLNNAFSAYRSDGSAANLKEFTKRFDIFYSRVKALDTGRALDALSQRGILRQWHGALYRLRRAPRRPVRP